MSLRAERGNPGMRRNMDRLDKILAHEGIGSRKDIRKILHRCVVTVNGRQVFDPSVQIDTLKDIIQIDGDTIDLHTNLYIMMNKPQHVVSSAKEGNHQTVFDLLDDSLRTPYLLEKLHLVGRLDMDTEGLLLFTTDGELTHRITSPRTHISKTYYCGLEHAETPDHQKVITEQFEQGIAVGPEDNEEGFTCQPAFLKWKDDSTALLTIYEGKYHQVKRMFAAVGNKIVYLKRMSMGELKLDPSLGLGEYRILTEEEILLLR